MPNDLVTPWTRETPPAREKTPLFRRAVRERKTPPPWRPFRRVTELLQPTPPMSKEAPAPETVILIGTRRLTVGGAPEWKR